MKEMICREGMVTFYRFHEGDKICISESAAYWWGQLGLGEIIKYGLNHPSHSTSQQEQNSEDSFLKIIQNQCCSNNTTS